jgi:hypothetical protein
MPRCSTRAPHPLADPSSRRSPPLVVARGRWRLIPFLGAVTPRTTAAAAAVAAVTSTSSTHTAVGAAAGCRPLRLRRRSVARTAPVAEGGGEQRPR